MSQAQIDHMISRIKEQSRFFEDGLISEKDLLEFLAHIERTRLIMLGLFT